MFINTAVPRARLTTAIEVGPAYLRPIMVAVRDAGVGFGIVAQDSGPFDFPSNRPTIVILGDDLWESKGPNAFHQKSLRRFVKRCRNAVIMACEPLPVAYAAAAATAAGFLRDVIIVETQPRHEADWKAALDAINPDLNYIICTVKPAVGVQ